MKSIIVASAFILAASTAAVPFTGKRSNGGNMAGPPAPPSEFMNKALAMAPVKPPVTPPQKPRKARDAGKAPKPPVQLPVAPPQKPEGAPAAEPMRRGFIFGGDNDNRRTGQSNNKAASDDGPMNKKTGAVDVTVHKRFLFGDYHRGNADDADDNDNNDDTDDTDDTDDNDDNEGNEGSLIDAAGGLTVSPKVRRDGLTDTDILQYALTLEHLEKAFYDGALKRFNKKSFAKAGFSPLVRERFEQIAAHEADHVTLLTNAIGDTAVAACDYNFPYHDPKSFAALSMVLEGVGVSAYLGAAQFIESKEYLTVAGSILTTESRHAAWVSSAVDKVSPWSGPFDTPLDLDQVYSLAAQFITSCPSTNAVLPVKAFPTLSIKNKKYAPGDVVTLQFDASSANGEPTYLVIFSGLDTLYAPIENNKVKLPAQLEGTSYGLVSTSDSAVADSNTVAGMAVFEFYEASYTY